MLYPQNLFEFSRLIQASIKIFTEVSSHNVIKQGGFSRARHSCDTDKLPQGDIYIYIFQIKLLCANHRKFFSVPCPSSFGITNTFFAGQKLTSDRLRVFFYFFWRTLCHQVPAVLTSQRSYIYKPITFPHGFFVVFYHNHRVPQITQIFKSVQELAVISLMKSNRRFI